MFYSHILGLYKIPNRIPSLFPEAWRATATSECYLEYRVPELDELFALRTEFAEDLSIGHFVSPFGLGCFMFGKRTNDIP